MCLPRLGVCVYSSVMGVKAAKGGRKEYKLQRGWEQKEKLIMAKWEHSILLLSVHKFVLAEKSKQDWTDNGCFPFKTNGAKTGKNCA